MSKDQRRDILAPLEARIVRGLVRKEIGDVIRRADLISDARGGLYPRPIAIKADVILAEL